MLPTMFREARLATATLDKLQKEVLWNTNFLYYEYNMKQLKLAPIPCFVC